MSTVAGALGMKQALGAEALLPLNRFPRMMQDWLVDQVKAAQAKGDARRNTVQTKEQAEAYVLEVRESIARCFGPMPEKTPLNAKITSTVERDTYRLENVVFESRPGFLVSGNLYVPTTGKGPHPAVLGVCGHSLNGKAAEAYQSFAQGLARMGYVVLIIDPVGQGERFQFVKEVPGKGLMSRYGGGVAEHIQMGNQMGLVDEFIGSWMVWDGIRGVDYLLTRPEVDASRIGVTGNSGGGTQTTWLCGLEPRFTMAAPACFVTTFLRNAENELPADTEQCPPAVLAEGLDHCDFLAAMAPKPVIICTQEKDYFDARGGQVAYERLKKLYTLLGKPENIQLQVGPDPHGYTVANREAMYAFFNKTTGVSQATTEPALVIEKDETLWAAPKGQVQELGSKSLMNLTQDKLAKLQPGTQQPLTERVRSVLKLATETAVPDYRILRTIGGRTYPQKHSCHYAVETEPGIHALVTRLSEESHVSRIPKGGKAVLYISHHSADADLRNEPQVKELIEAHPGAVFFACDVRGIGESQPNTCGTNTFLTAYGCDYFYSAYSVMLNRPILGQRTLDVLAVLELLAATGHSEIHLAGKGWGALPAAFAALLSPHVKSVHLKHALTSYRDIANEENYKWPYALLPKGLLTQFDLPEVYEALKAKSLVNAEPWGAGDGMTTL
jgi:cephalosporin-C deacetylase-like acetyl esterase